MPRPACAAWRLLLTPLALACGERPATVATARVDTLRPGLVQMTSPAPTGWTDPAGAWQYRETLRIQPGERTPGELIEPDGIAVDEWGRIFVVDHRPHAIKLYDSSGAFIRTFGREGGGPGEYRAAFIAVRGGHLVVQDPEQGRASVFDTSGTFLRSWPTSCCYWDRVGIDSAGLIYIPSVYSPDSGQNNRGQALRRYRLDSTLVDTVFVPNQQAEEKSWKFSGSAGSGSARSTTTVFMGIPLAPRIVKALHPAGGFVLGWSGAYRILRSRTGEDTTMILARAWTPDPIPEAQRRQEVERVVKNTKGMVGEATARAVARLGDVPENAPAFTALAVDLDGNIFARQLVGSDSTQTRFDVFSPAGAWLGALTIPASMPEFGGQFYGRRAIYFVVEGEDGRPAIVRFTRAP